MAEFYLLSQFSMKFFLLLDQDQSTFFNKVYKCTFSNLKNR